MAEARNSSSSALRRARPGDESIGQFIIGGEIGKGSFAQVYMGKHKVSPLQLSQPRYLLVASCPILSCISVFVSYPLELYKKKGMQRTSSGRASLLF